MVDFFFLLNSNTSTIRSEKKATNLLASCYQVSLIHSLKFLSKTTIIFLPHVNPTFSSPISLLPPQTIPTFSIYMPMASRFLSSRLLSKPLAALAVSSAAYLRVKNNTYAIMRPPNASKNDHPRFSTISLFFLLC